MKLLLDMGISVHLVPILRAQGHEVTHVADISSGSMADPDILARARLEGEIVVAHDLDFPDLMAASGSRSPSVVVFRLRDMRPEKVESFLRQVLATARESLARGAIVSVSEGGIRVRLLPVVRG